MRVSVLIPSFNHGRFIGEALTSVLSGPFEDLEVVLVDDGSTDDTLEVVEAFHTDSRLAVHTQTNQGAHAALNRCISLARGDLVFILNSDDAFEPERIPRLVELFDTEPQPAMATSWLRIVDEDGAILGVKRGAANMPPWPPPGPGPHLSDLGDPQLALLEQNWVATTSNMACRRNLFTDHGLSFSALRYAHDWDFLLAACRCGPIALVEEPLVRYRVHGANTIREGSRQDGGQGLMRFEILWLLARHVPPTLVHAEARGFDGDDVQARLWHSLPHFGQRTILQQLLLMRGDEKRPPAAFDALLQPDHPYRRAAVSQLAG